MLLPLLLLVVAIASAESSIDVGFCDDNGNGFYAEQPQSQMERWHPLPFDNGTHLVIPWRSDKRVSGMNVSAYEVDVKTSVPVLNIFIGTFGSFPQDVRNEQNS